LIIYKMKEEQYLLVVNASNIDKDWDWFRLKMIWVSRWKPFGWLLLLAIQGPKAVEAMQGLSSIDLSAIPYYHFEVADFAGLNM
jgi:aminomethyltransferase